MVIQLERIGTLVSQSGTATALTSTSSFLNVPFLNLMSNIVARAGSVVIRVGGNTQDNAVLVNELPNGTIISKDTSIKGTPTIDYTSDLMQMMANVSQLLNAWWYLGKRWTFLQHDWVLMRYCRYSVLQHHTLRPEHRREGTSDSWRPPACTSGCQRARLVLQARPSWSSKYALPLT